MSTVLFNPTNEDFDAQYVGVTYDIVAGGKLKVDDKAARHILNTLGPRGLMSLDFGDEGEGEAKKAKLGRRRNHEFKRKQVIRFNAENSKRETSRLPPQEPSEQMSDYADEVGIKLLQPYRPEGEESEKIGRLSQELSNSAAALVEKDKDIKVLQTQVGDLTDKMQTFMDMMAGKKDVKEKTDDPEVTEDTEEIAAIIKKQYSGLPKYGFQDWVVKNWDMIPGYPDEIQTDIDEMWQSFFNEDLPIERPVLPDKPSPSTSKKKGKK